MLLEHGLDGLLHSASWRDLHDLGDLVGEVHFKHVPLVNLVDAQMLQREIEKEME